MQEKNDERIPAPVESTKIDETKGKIKNTDKTKKRVFSVLAVALIVALSFTGGFFTRWFTIDKGMRKLIDVKNKIDKEYYEDVSDEKFYDAIFDAINDEVLDPYSRYINADDYASERAENAGKRSGLGLVFYGTAESDAAQTTVYRVCGNSPAERAGFLAGDRLTGFGLSETELADCADFTSFSRFLGELRDGQTFYTRIERKGETLTLSVALENYVESYVFYKTNTQSYTIVDEDELIRVGEPLSDLDDETAYIRLIRFAGEADDLFEEAMDLFKKQGKKNLVLDLRGNGGGEMRILQEIGEYLCKDAAKDDPVVAIADYGGKKEYFKADENEYYEYFSADSRVCVIADENTASASEALIGAMIDYHTVGYDDICLIEKDGTAKTYGKGIMQTTFIMDWIEGDALKLTTARIVWPKSGTCIHDRGILSSDGTKTAAKNYQSDEELSAAIKALFS